MSEINNKIHELHHVDMMAGREGWLSRFHPLAKVLVTVIFIYRHGTFLSYIYVFINLFFIHNVLHFFVLNFKIIFQQLY